ncbi:hypothetical protein A4G99_07855 [Haladaptatus sp. R4]|uniref:hypothetical protein n=1 Tax=Haladaptatus sp. R4 TaxID=1679489 RepID=UPI0007B4E33B|nr:hypothetical protein [Haladaptatus sp. R4]KZN24319.1 hypothetical protein A4G99_07855 [Haladaptatus sp. R4]
MKSPLETLQNFGELEDHEKVRFLIRGSGVMIVLLGVLLFFTLDGMFVPAIFVVVGLLDVTVISTFIANQQKKSNESI